MEVSILPTLIAGVTISLFFLLWISTFYRTYLIPLIIGFSLRAIFIVVHEQTRVFSDADINDFLPYYLQFEKALQFGDILSFIQPHAAFYTVLYPGWIFSLVGESGLWVERVINSLLGVSVIIPLVWINRVIFNRKMHQLQVYLIVLWPSWIVHNVFIGRTALSVFSVLISLAILLELSNQRHINKQLFLWVFFGMSAFLVCMLRVHEIAYFIPILSLGLFGSIDRLKNIRYIRPILYSCIFFISIPISLGLIQLYQVLIASRYNLEGDSLENAISIAKGGEFGGSVYLEGIYPNTPLDWFWYLPIQGFHFLFSPLPWSINTPFAAISSFQALFVLGLCLYSFYKARKLIWENSLLKLLVITILFTCLAFGSGVKNAGSAERWRMPLTLSLLTISTSLISESRTIKNRSFPSRLNFS